jgi:hypothetical protein
MIMSANLQTKLNDHSCNSEDGIAEYAIEHN